MGCCFSLCFPSEPEVSYSDLAAINLRLSEVESLLQQKNMESETYQHQLITKALEETTENATGELGKLHEMVQRMKGAQEALDGAEKQMSEANTFLPMVQLVKEQEHRVKKLSIVVFEGKGMCTLTIKPLHRGEPYSIDNMTDYKTPRISGCAVAQPGDVVSFNCFDDRCSAYVIAVAP